MFNTKTSTLLLTGALLWLSACGEATETPEPAPADMMSMVDMPVDLAPSCPDASQTSCSGTCTNLQEDVNNCGECGKACGFKGLCSDGECGCLNGGTWCGPGQCMQTLNDSRHCGACNNKCEGGTYCADGTCVMGPEIAEILRLTNEARAVGRMCGDKSFGPAAPLQINTKLNTSAQGHSEDMERRNFFDHDNPDGKTATERMREAGYTGRFTGENIAVGQDTPQEVMEAWIDSPGHCSGIMNPNFTELGVGFFKTSTKGPWWTQNFGAP